MRRFLEKNPWFGNERGQSIGFVALLLFSLVFLGVVCAGSFRSAPYRLIQPDEEFALSDNWLVTGDDGVTFSVQLPAQLGASSDGPRSIRRALPDTLPPDPGICFRSTQQNVRVLLNEQCIYTYSTDGNRPYGDATPSKWCFVRLSGAKPGDIVRIALDTPYEDYAGTFNNVFFSSYSRLKLYIMLTYLPDFVVCIGIFVLGAILYIMFVCLAPRNPLYGNMRYIGLFTACISLYLLMETEFPDIGIFNAFFELLLKYLSLSVVTMPFLLYVKMRLGSENSLMLDILFWLFLVNHLVQISLQLLGIVNTMQMVVDPLRITHTLISISALTVIYMYSVAIYRKRIQLYTAEIFAFAGIIAAIAMELINYYRGEFGDIGSALQVGVLLFSSAIAVAALQNAADRTADSIKLKNELQQSQTQLMISQIQPHFIYNTLHAIRALIKIAPEEASQMTLNFSKYLRANIDALGLSDPIPFQKEIEHVRAYTDIELVRFSDRLHVEWELQAQDFNVPPLTIQPLVENAIKHGVCKKEEGGTVRIVSRADAAGYIVEIIDDGVGMHPELEQKQSSAGLRNVRMRLKYISNATLTIRSRVGTGTTATIRIPRAQQ